MALRSCFRGSLAGALIGDALGAFWETQSWQGTHQLDDVERRIDEQVRQALSKKAPPIGYTDDTALTIAVAESLVECRGYDEERMARKLVDTYFDDPRRGYGGGVGTVFYRLRQSKFADLYQPARDQFNGQGSFGNGAAMRISPAGLFGYKDDSVLTEVVSQSSRLTHAHVSAINGALLQAMAVKLALQSQGQSLKPTEFVDTLMTKISPFEQVPAQESKASGTDSQEQDSQMSTSASSFPAMVGDQPSMQSKLQQIRDLLTAEELPTAYAVQERLGHGVRAGEAVPCAIYAFLRFCHKPSFRELIPFAISLGGDTDTIASMAGAMGGAYWGEEVLPKEWLDCCEGVSNITSLADALYKIVN